MHLLCLDIGAGTQDILFLDTSQSVENSIQLVLPAPTVLVARAIERATQRRQALFLTGEVMGGGANTAALKRHLQAGLPVYAIPQAALTFHDDLDVVAGWGVKLASPDEAPGKARAIELGDLKLRSLFQGLGVRHRPQALAVAVLDHGVGPKGESNRRFRFQHLKHWIEAETNLEALSYLPDELPPYLTRMKAVAQAAQALPLVLSDTGVAAALGALQDREVAQHPHRLITNLGNSHTLAFHLWEGRVLGLFEHHTSLLSRPQIEELVARLILGEISQEEVWGQGGHGALVWESKPHPFLVATGPRRGLWANSKLKPYLATPYGSMMLTGCFGLARASALRFEQWREEIEKILA